MSVELLPVRGLPEVRPGDDLAELLAPPLRELGLREGDVLVVTQKVVSKAEGRLVRARQEERAAWVAREARRIVARRGELVIAETRHGFVCANAGVDASNVPPGHVSLLPEDPDASAAHIRASLIQRFGREHAVIITDSFGRPWRNGIVNIAIGAAGMQPLLDYRGQADTFGNELRITIMAVADELAAAAELVMGKVERCPAAIVRGYRYQPGPGRAADLVMPPERDLFR